MTQSNSSLKEIEAVLRKHFSDSNNDLFEWQALDIWMSWGESQTVQELARANVPPQNDIDTINKTISYLKRARESLKSVGWHGGNALRPLAGEIRQESIPENHRPIVHPFHSSNVIGEKLAQLEKGLESASEYIDVKGVPVPQTTYGSLLAEYSGEGFKKGRPPIIIAIRVARECANTFEVLSGKKPTLIIAAISSEEFAPTGEFFAFLSAVFDALEIDANVEHAAKVALRRKAD